MKHTYLRGDIYYADLGHGVGSEQEGCRPVVIIQNNVGNKYSPTVIVASITSKAGEKAKLPTHYYIDTGGDLKLPSIVLLEQLRTIDKRRLGNFIGHLSEKQTCANNFYNPGIYYLRRVDPYQTTKGTCTYCNSRKGLDYEVVRK